MNATIKGILNDVYQSEFLNGKGEKVKFASVEFYNPEFRTQRDRYLTFTMSIEKVGQLGLLNDDVLKKYKGKTVTAEGQLVFTKDGMKFKILDLYPEQ